MSVVTGCKQKNIIKGLTILFALLMILPDSKSCGNSLERDSHKDLTGLELQSGGGGA